MSRFMLPLLLLPVNRTTGVQCQLPTSPGMGANLGGSLEPFHRGLMIPASTDNPCAANECEVRGGLALSVPADTFVAGFTRTGSDDEATA